MRADAIIESLREKLSAAEPKGVVEEVGRVIEVGDGIAKVSGLRSVASMEMVSFESADASEVSCVALNLEEHEVGGVKKKVWVHRKGATRAFPAGHPDVPEMYRDIGQPVIIPGDMGRASWVLCGR